MSNPSFSATRMHPVEAHLAHLRHLSVPSGLAPVLKERHGFSKSDGRKIAKDVSPYINQANAFCEAARQAPARVRPVLQYYAYLNFAVATVLIFRPSNWSGYRKHGAEDKTRSLTNIALSSKVVRVQTGAIKLFHSILCSGELPKQSIPLKHLLISIPMISAELSQAFRIKSYRVQVVGGVKTIGSGKNQRLVSYFDLEIPAEPDGNPTEYPSKRISTALPSLRRDYRLENTGSLKRGYVSKKRWTLQNKDRAERFHEDRALKIINYGGQTTGDIQQIYFAWPVSPECPLIPTMSASLSCFLLC